MIMTEQYQQTPFIVHKKRSKTYWNLNRDENNQHSKITADETGQELYGGVRLNEWTFTLLLFMLSLSIVIGKLFSNYDSYSLLEINNNKIISITNNNTDCLINRITSKVLVEYLNSYKWIIQAIFSGLATTGITWFIIYKDSTLPGINPPSPFSAGKQRISESHTLEINYFVGVLNGLLVFLYMCL